MTDYAMETIPSLEGSILSFKGPEVSGFEDVTVYPAGHNDPAGPVRETVSAFFEKATAKVRDNCPIEDCTALVNGSPLRPDLPDLKVITRACVSCSNIDSCPLIQQ